MTGHVTDTHMPKPLDDVIGDGGLRAAIAYWDSLRGARVLPSRMDLDPVALRPNLQDAAILEVAGPGSLRIRLGGGRINALLGMDVRGLPFRALFDLSERAKVSADVEAAIGDATLMILDVQSPAPRFGRPDSDLLRAQIAILPMTDADLAPTRALYVMSAVTGDMRAADAPYRWCVVQRRGVPLQAGTRVTSATPPLRRPAGPVPAPTADTGPTRDTAPTEGIADTEAAAEKRGPLARARFRVIDGGRG